MPVDVGVTLVNVERRSFETTLWEVYTASLEVEQMMEETKQGEERPAEERPHLAEALRRSEGEVGAEDEQDDNREHEQEQDLWNEQD